MRMAWPLAYGFWNRFKLLLGQINKQTTNHILLKFQWYAMSLRLNINAAYISMWLKISNSALIFSLIEIENVWRCVQPNERTVGRACVCACKFTGAERNSTPTIVSDRSSPIDNALCCCSFFFFLFSRPTNIPFNPLTVTMPSHTQNLKTFFSAIQANVFKQTTQRKRVSEKKINKTNPNPNVYFDNTITFFASKTIISFFSFLLLWTGKK